MGLTKQLWYGKIDGATGQTVATIGAERAICAGKPVVCAPNSCAGFGVFVLEHLVAIFAKLHHIIRLCDIAEAQDFGNVHLFGAGQTGVAEGTE